MFNKFSLLLIFVCSVLIYSCSTDEDKLGVKIVNLSGQNLEIYQTPDIQTIDFEFVESIPVGFDGVLDRAFNYNTGTFLEARTEDEMRYAEIWFFEDPSVDVFVWTIN